MRPAQLRSRYRGSSRFGLSLGSAVVTGVLSSCLQPRRFYFSPWKAQASGPAPPAQRAWVLSPPHTCIQLVSESWPTEVVRASVTPSPLLTPGLPTPMFSSLFSCPPHLQEPLPAPRPLLQPSPSPAQSQSLCPSPEIYCSSHNW